MLSLLLSLSLLFYLFSLRRCVVSSWVRTCEKLQNLLRTRSKTLNGNPKMDRHAEQNQTNIEDSSQKLYLSADVKECAVRDLENV